MPPRSPLLAKIAATGLFALGAFAGMSGLAPEPDPVPRRWELRVEVGPMRVTSFDVGGKPRAFTYMTYRVVNKSGHDLLFAPSFEMSFGGNKTLRAGSDVPADVTAKLMDKIDNPLVQDQIGIIGTLLQGDENARDGLVVWSCESLAPGKLALYAAGFSGETATVELPSQKDPKVKEKAVLRKTLMVTYSPGGEITERGDHPIEVAEQRWIMR